MRVIYRSQCAYDLSAFPLTPPELKFNEFSGGEESRCYVFDSVSMVLYVERGVVRYREVEVVEVDQPAVLPRRYVGKASLKDSQKQQTPEEHSGAGHSSQVMR